MTRTLLLILAALALMIASFVWFVTTWDRDREQPISRLVPSPNVNQFLTIRIAECCTKRAMTTRGFVQNGHFSL